MRRVGHGHSGQPKPSCPLQQHRDHVGQEGHGQQPASVWWEGREDS